MTIVERKVGDPHDGGYHLRVWGSCDIRWQELTDLEVFQQIQLHQLRQCTCFNEEGR